MRRSNTRESDSEVGGFLEGLRTIFREKRFFLLGAPGLGGTPVWARPLFWSAPTSKLSFEAPNTTFFDRLDIFSDATNLKITLVAFVSALPAPRAAPE